MLNRTICFIFLKLFFLLEENVGEIVSEYYINMNMTIYKKC